MSADAFLFTYADEDFYAPLGSSVLRGEEYRPTTVPDGWTDSPEGIWTHWRPLSGGQMPDQGWKIHLSATIGRAQVVLDTAAEVFFAEGTPFKHLTASRFFLLNHHKHMPRAHSGKFCAAYPADAAAARRLMERLTQRLDGEEGPYVLTDRPFSGSRVVYYRYGGFRPRFRLLPDGTREYLTRDGFGRDVPDLRKVAAPLPEGITDPFTPAVPGGSAPAVFHGYEFVRVVRYSNSGGTYQGIEQQTGRSVFIKEARPHTGLVSPSCDARDRLRSEYATLRELHPQAPGICPEPLAYFDESGHEFLVTEFVPGVSLYAWMAENNPAIWPMASGADFRAYHERCTRIIAALGETLKTLHRLGRVFVDLNSHNVILGTGDQPRLVDFEVAGSVLGVEVAIGAPGYFPPADVVGEDPKVYDEYGLSSIALALLAPINRTADRAPAVTAHLRHALEQFAPLPEQLWETAVRFREPPPTSVDLPRPEAVAADPAGHLSVLRDQLISGLLAAADPEHADRVFPSEPMAYATNTVCVAYGTAGVVHALSRAGTLIPEEITARFRREALDQRTALPPGLQVGLAGVAWVLADLGLLEEARELLDVADRHPLLSQCDNAGYGRAGVGLAHLALFAHTADGRHLDRALAAGSGHDAPPPEDTVGLLSGRAGTALLLYYLSRLTDDSVLLKRGVRLLHDDLVRGRLVNGGLLFPVSRKNRRLMPYLYSGTAGIAMVTSRYLTVTDDPVLSSAMPQLLSGISMPFTVLPGLYRGLAGLGLTLADHARRHHDPQAGHGAWLAGRRLFLHTVPGPGGMHVLGGDGTRLSCELWGGSAGALLFVDTLLAERPDPLFTLDTLTDGGSPRENSAGPTGPTGAHRTAERRYSHD